MEDVIFAGTRDRKPLGMAQVTLTMVDPASPGARTHKVQDGDPVNGTNGTATDRPAQVFRITITPAYIAPRKRISHRWKIARLATFRICHGHGPGPESYAIIEQGALQILSINGRSDAPLSKRLGIGNKDRKRWESKLESSKQNWRACLTSSKSRAAGEFTQAPGFEGKTLRRIAHRDAHHLRRAVLRRFRAGGEAAKLRA